MGSLEYLSDISENLLPTILIILFVLWTQTKLFRFKDSSVKKAIFVTLVFSLFSLLFGFSILLLYYFGNLYVPFLKNIILTVYSLRFVADYLALLLLIKKVYGENWKKTLIVFILAFFFSLILNYLWVSIRYPYDPNLPHIPVNTEK
jgi:hypothetical protein